MGQQVGEVEEGITDDGKKIKKENHRPQLKTNLRAALETNEHIICGCGCGRLLRQ